ncbi:unnamed protein product [Parajaminaea phylloscopi]
MSDPSHAAIPDVAMPFADIDAEYGRIILGVTCYLFLLLGFHLHYNLSGLYFDYEMIRRGGWDRPYLVVSRACYLSSKWLACVNLVLNSLYFIVPIPSCSDWIAWTVITGFVSWSASELMFLLRLAPLCRAAAMRQGPILVGIASLFIVGQTAAIFAYFRAGVQGRVLTDTRYCTRYGSGQTLKALQACAILSALFHVYNYFVALYLMDSLHLFNFGSTPSRLGRLLFSQETRVFCVCSVLATIIAITMSIDRVPNLIKRKLVVLLTTLLNCVACSFYRQVDTFLSNEMGVFTRRITGRTTEDTINRPYTGARWSTAGEERPSKVTTKPLTWVTSVTERSRPKDFPMAVLATRSVLSDGFNAMGPRRAHELARAHTHAKTSHYPSEGLKPSDTWQRAERTQTWDLGRSHVRNNAFLQEPRVWADSLTLKSEHRSTDGEAASAPAMCSWPSPSTSALKQSDTGTLSSRRQHSAAHSDVHLLPSSPLQSSPISTGHYACMSPSSASSPLLKTTSDQVQHETHCALHTSLPRPPEARTDVASATIVEEDVAPPPSRSHGRPTTASSGGTSFTTAEVRRALSRFPDPAS